MTPHRAKAAHELLAFYVESGVDALVDEVPVDRFADAGAASGASELAPVPAPLREGDVSRRLPGREPDGRASDPRRGVPSVAFTPAAAGGAPLPPDAAAMAARDAARQAQSLEELRAIMQAFQGCALRLTAKQLVFGDGNPQARLMLVGEAPGREEDLEGLPFVGRSGQLLNRMLAAIGYDRTSAYIANIIPWRPPGNRTPTPQESAICLPFIQRQIELANPEVVVCLGGPSMQTLLGVKDGIRKTRGRWFPYHTDSREIRAMPTFHPAYLLRSPLEKRHAWRDFLAIKKALAG
jgi:uracil-DNA glycosylase family 4